MSEAKRLLVIDDEPDFAALVVTVATRLGYAASAAANPRAFRQAVIAAPDVIVLDIVMPEQDGVELIQWLDAINCTARVVIVTGFNPAYAESARRLAEIRGRLQVSVIHKPVKLDDLRAAIAH